MPLTVLIAREALVPMLSQPRRPGSRLPRRLILLESAWSAGSASIISTLAPSRAAASATFSAAMLRSTPAVGADHGQHRDRRWRARRFASVARMSRMALRKLISGRPARSVGQPIRVTSGTPPVVRIPPSVRITSASCRRAIDGFSIAADVAGRGDEIPSGCFAGDTAVGGRGFGRPRLSESARSRSAATVQPEAASAPKAKPSDRQKAHRRRESAPLRHGSFADDPRARGIEAFLFLGLARALEERLIDVAAGVDFALQFAQPHRSLAEFDALVLLRLERLVERGFVVAGAGQVVFRRLGEAIDFFADGAAQVVDLFLHLAQRGMQRARVRWSIRHSVCGPRHIARANWRWSETAALREWRRHRSRHGGWPRSDRILPARRASARVPRRAAGCSPKAAGR